jgi:methylenetetrahydrofolate dehydrogenase (NADP+)/methenyltetrahydrofolate cyclohydrolase
MTVIFDGKKLAAGIEKKLSRKIVRVAKNLGRKPKLATVCNPDDPMGRFYTNVKMKKAKELGIDVAAYPLKSTIDWEGLVVNLNRDPHTDGVMIQLPLTGDRARDMKLCLLIDPRKDVDGLNLRSGIKQATVRAVLMILKEAIKTTLMKNINMVVVGSWGNVGRSLVRELKCEGMDKDDWNPSMLREARVIISCTGQEGLIKPEMVKDNVICIDVGYPHGDFAPEVAEKASFFTPVPGGVGPVTVACLFNNLIELIEAGYQKR